jgi:hypothetical protein
MLCGARGRCLMNSSVFVQLVTSTDAEARNHFAILGWRGTRQSRSAGMGSNHAAVECWR